MTARPKALRLYFSFRSPYSWLAAHMLHEHAARLERVELVPYWEPDAELRARLAVEGADFQYTPMSKAKHLYILQDVRRLARRLGLAVTWPIDREPRWEPSHLGFLVAAQLGRATAQRYMMAVFAARFSQGRDISDRETLRAIAHELGLPADAIADAADDPVWRARGAALLAQADRDGVFGIPYFVHGRDRFWGIDRIGEFLATLDEGTATTARQEPPAPAPVLLGAEDHAGGCG